MQIFDGTTLLTTQTLQGNGCAYWYVSPGLAAGTHSLTSTYSGDKNNPAGTSAATVLHVSPVPVNMSVSCWNASFNYGANYQCNVSASSNAGSALGAVTYAFDGGQAQSVSLSNGSAQFTIPAPAVGNHSVTIAYAQQTNYAAATASAQSFTVTPAGTNVSLNPSTYYASTGTSITFTAAVTSWSASTPSSVGSVSFYDNGSLLGAVALNSNGTAALSKATLASGTHTITSTFAGAANYATASSTATITVAN
jgi:plastocyanin